MTPHTPLLRTPTHRSFARRAAAFVVAAVVIGGAPLVAEAATSDAPTVDATWQTTSRGQKPVFQPTAEAERPEIEPETQSEPEPEPVAEPETEPVAEPETEPVAEPETEPVAEPETESPEEVAVVPSVAVLTANYEWDERGERVESLQQLLGVSADGWYGQETAAAHRSALEYLQLEPAAVPEPALPPGPSADQWAALRQCEAGGDYSISSASGKYRGAYQFDQSTWDSVAGRHAPQLVGVHPAQAAPADQDAQARALYSERGANPWPQCGRHLR